MNSTQGVRVFEAGRFFVMGLALAVVAGTAACSTEIEPADDRGSETVSETTREGDEGREETTGTSESAFGIARPIGKGFGAASGGSSCSIPPLHCGGKVANRGVYPGCSVSCGPGETAMCIAGDCFWSRSPSCTCQGSYLPQ